MRKTALLFSALMLFSLACKKTVDSEKKAWEYNLKRMTKLSYEYPSFKGVIGEQQKAAEAVMNEAASISDEKAKIEKMAGANSMMRVTFLRNLDRITDLKDSINRKAIQVRGMSMSWDKRSGADQAVYSGERAVSEADVKLKSPVTTVQEAEALSSIALRTLERADSGLQSIIRDVEAQKKTEQAKEKQLQEEKAKVEQTRIESTQPVKCSYCGTLNEPTAVNCKNCGAPLPKK